MATATCYRHRYRARPAAGSCCRCGRLLCEECGVDAPVGRHCEHCAPEQASGVAAPAFPRVAPGPLVKGLIALNVLIYAIQQGDPTVVGRFADNANLVAEGEYYRLITAAFLHGSLFHLLFNMGALFVFGSQIEGLVGRTRFVAIYLVAAVGGSTASLIFQPPTAFGVGASGALFGLLGAYVPIAAARRLEVRSVLALIAINLMLGVIEPSIDNWAHLGGLVVGLCLGAVFAATASLDPTRRAAVQAVAVVATCVVIAMLVGARVQDVRQDRNDRVFEELERIAPGRHSGRS